MPKPALEHPEEEQERQSASSQPFLPGPEQFVGLSPGRSLPRTNQRRPQPGLILGVLLGSPRCAGFSLG